MVAPATYTENLTIGFSLKVIGSGAKTTIIDGGGVNTVVSIINASIHVTLSKVTIQNGNHPPGGGINNSGTLTVNNSTIRRNTAYGLCGTRHCHGGGIENGGTLTINRSTVSGNSAPVGGGGIENYGPLTVSNSTLSGNSAGQGGGIDGTATLQNSIVANNSGGNCDSTMTSDGYNLSSDNTCNFNGPGDLNNTNPELKKLGNYGGPTETMALPAGSPAIDAGNPSGCTDGNGHLLKTDQRGYPRPGPHDHHGCDMGAFENQKH